MNWNPCVIHAYQIISVKRRIAVCRRPRCRHHGWSIFCSLQAFHGSHHAKRSKGKA